MRCFAVVQPKRMRQQSSRWQSAGPSHPGRKSIAQNRGNVKAGVTITSRIRRSRQNDAVPHAAELTVMSLANRGTALQTCFFNSCFGGSAGAGNREGAVSEVEDFSGVMPVRESHRFDIERLAAWMREHVEGFHGPLKVEQFKGGQSNPTYRLTTPQAHYVLRRKPPGKLLPSAHAVEREYRVITALGQTDVPVARTYGLCTDDAVIGTAFYIMECVVGRVFWDPALPELAPGDRAPVYEAMNEVIARLHKIDYAAIGLADYGKPGNYVKRQIERWTTQYRASETETIEAMDRLIDWLPQNAPEGDETSIVHGDYRLDNMIFHPTEPRVLAVLDWELSTLGNPVSDFAYHMMTWRLGAPAYRGLAGLDLPSLGIPTEERYRALYCRRTGRTEIPHWDFYMAYNMFRLAAILQGIMGRVMQGTASNVKAREHGGRARAMAEAGWRQVEAMTAKK
jgi:aminoglycoside phosphotransferase (APT) family kinase protein